MTSSLARVAGISMDSLQSAVVLLDRGLRLQGGAVRNAARAVAADRVSARLRAEATAALAQREDRRELTLVGA